MNPYAPPLANDEPPLAEGLLMQVRYGAAYTWFMVAIAVLLPLPNTLLALHSSSSFKPLLAVGWGCPMFLWLAWKSRHTVFFEVFEDRLEFLSLGFKWRCVKKPLSQRIARWIANREDFAKFEAWRQARGVM